MDHAAWQKSNNEFLTQRLEELRLRLGKLAEGSLPTSDQGLTVDDAAAPAAETSSELPALELLGTRLGLSAFEQEILLLCAAMELDPRVAELCALAQRDSAKPYPTFALAMTLFDEPAWETLAPESPLRRFKLIELHQPGATPLTAAALRADERIASYIKGLNTLDDRLAPLLLPFDSQQDLPLPPSQQSSADELVQQLEQLAVREQRQALPVLQLAGPDPVSKQLVARHVAGQFGLELLRLPADLIPADFNELETLLRLWDREQRLLPLGLYVDAHDADQTPFDRPASPLNRFLSRAAGLIILDLPESRATTGRNSVVCDVLKPTPAEQRVLWQELTGDNEALAVELAAQFSLNPATIREIAENAGIRGRTRRKSKQAIQDSTQMSPLWNACRRATRPRLQSLAQRIDARATWDNLVLPDEELRQLREIAGQVRFRGRVYDDWGFRARHNRGLGISVLFAGESGTGKTMAAEVIANDLQLDLYRIDLSAVVNKYIGETEKNLRRLFDAADDGGAILLFDEADSLFGKRTEVKDSHDRYANLEVNYLLQRMEAYRGLAILATNLKSSIDKAFLRRLRFLVNFPVPDATHRAELWRKAFPADMPVDYLDYERLSRLNVTAGNIHTIALNAAFASAAEPENSSLSMQHLLSATRSEYRKLQKPLNASDFRPSELEGVVR